MASGVPVIFNTWYTCYIWHLVYLLYLTPGIPVIFDTWFTPVIFDTWYTCSQDSLQCFIAIHGQCLHLGLQKLQLLHILSSILYKTNTLGFIATLSFSPSLDWVSWNYSQLIHPSSRPVTYPPKNFDVLMLGMYFPLEIHHLTLFHTAYRILLCYLAESSSMSSLVKILQCPKKSKQPFCFRI